MITDHDDLARLIFEATAQSTGPEDLRRVAARLVNLSRGIPAEDEFSAVVGWLGRCRLIHRLSQDHRPSSSYRVPDLLAIFEYENRAVPVLIEVKVCKKRTLSWTPEYLRSLTNYAAVLNLPLLIAWKHGTLWVLFEPRHLRLAVKNLNIRFVDALPESLMSLIAGDFSFSFRPGAGLSFKLRKNDKTETGWNATIEEARFIHPDGSLVATAPGVLPLFGCIDQESEIEETESHLIQRFVIPDHQQAEFAHRALVTILTTFNREHRSPQWRAILKRKSDPAGVIDIHDKARQALKHGFLNIVGNIQPRTMPEFLITTPG